MSNREENDGRHDALRGEDLLANLAMRREAQRPDSPLYSDEQVVAWLDQEANAREWDSDGWSPDRIRATASWIQSLASARLLKVRPMTGPPRLEPAGVRGTIPQVLQEATELGAAPQLDLSAAAGVGRDLWDEPCDSWVQLPEDVPRGQYIAVRVSGESMIPLFHTGDTVLVQLGAKISRDTVVLARLPDGGYAIKRVGRVTQARLELISLNADFAPIVLRRDERTVIGTVVVRWCPHSESARAPAG